MPKIVRWIAFLLIGLPGGIVWILGNVVFFVAVAAALGGEMEWPATPLGLFVGGLLAIIGFAMMVCSEILLGTPRYRVPWARFTACIGLDALVVHLTFLSGGLVVASFFMLMRGDWLKCVLFLTAGGFLIWVRSLTDRRWKSLRSKWQEEHHPDSLAAHPSAVDETRDY